MSDTPETKVERKQRWKKSLDETEFPMEQMAEVIKNASRQYKGDLTVLESAIGLLFMCVMFGRRPMLIIHSASTIRKYEAILGARLTEFDFIQETTGMSDRANGFALAMRAAKFWNVVRGQYPVEGRKDAVVVD
jgi:hypothetical protein